MDNLSLIGSIFEGGNLYFSFFFQWPFWIYKNTVKSKGNYFLLLLTRGGNFFDAIPDWEAMLTSNCRVKLLGPNKQRASFRYVS